NTAGPPANTPANPSARCFSPRLADWWLAMFTTAIVCKPATASPARRSSKKKIPPRCCILAIGPRSTEPATCSSRRRAREAHRIVVNIHRLENGPDQVRGDAQCVRSGRRRNGRGLAQGGLLDQYQDAGRFFLCAVRRRVADHRPVVFAASAPGLDEPDDTASHPEVRASEAGAGRRGGQ